MERIVLHLDMDAFFAAVEERDEPRFVGRPIVVGADPKAGKGRGVVSTANYAARKYGIRSAMPITEAWRRAEAAKKRGEPEVVFLGGDPRKYAEVSGRIMEILRERAEQVEQVSVDEAFADVSHLDDFVHAEEFARELKEAIREKERLTCSIGEQETFEEDTKDMTVLGERLKYLAGEVHRRFLKSGFKAFRTVVVTVRFADFETKSRTHTLSEPTRKKEAIEFEALKLLLPFLDRRENPCGKRVRLLGVRVEKLV